MSDKGHCKHGEFLLVDGCPQCIEEKRLLPGVAVKPEEEQPSLVKVQYFSETKLELSARSYTYYSANRLAVGDIVMVPVKDRTTKAKVIAIDVPESEVEAFKDKVKTISAQPAFLILPQAIPGKTIEETEAIAREVILKRMYK